MYSLNNKFILYALYNVLSCLGIKIVLILFTNNKIIILFYSGNILRKRLGNYSVER